VAQLFGCYDEGLLVEIAPMTFPTMFLKTKARSRFTRRRNLCLCRHFQFGLFLLLLLAGSLMTHAQRQMENLGRGVVAVRSSSTQAFISWRLLALDPAGIGFNVYRSANGAASV